MELCECGGEILRAVSRTEGPVYVCIKCEKLIETLRDRLLREADEAIQETTPT